MDPVYGYQSVNVEAQVRNTSSQLHWMRRMLEVRKQHPVFGTGSFEVISVENPSVLAYVRTSPAERRRTSRTRCRPAPTPGRSARPVASRPVPTSCCVCAISPVSPSPPSCRSSVGRAKRPLELLGRVPFPRIGELPYFVTLAPYGFYWFELVDPPWPGIP